MRQQRDGAQGSLEAASRGRGGAEGLRRYRPTRPSCRAGSRASGSRCSSSARSSRTVSFAIGKAVRDAGGTVVRTRSISVPLDPRRCRRRSGAVPAFRQLAGTDRLDALGTALADELATGEPDAALGCTRRARWCRSVRAPRPLRSTPSWSFARPSLSVARRRRSSRVCTPVLPARGRPPSAPRPRTRPRARFPAFALAGLSTVDSVDTAAGRLGLVLAPRRRRARQLRRRQETRPTASCPRSLPRRRRGERPPQRPRRRP